MRFSLTEAKPLGPIPRFNRRINSSNITQGLWLVLVASSCMPSPSELPELIWESRKSQVLASSDVHATLLERVRKIIIAVHEQMLSMRPWISTSLRRGRQCVSLTSLRSTSMGAVQAVTGVLTDSSNSHMAYLMRSQEQNTQNQNRVRL